MLIAIGTTGEVRTRAVRKAVEALNLEAPVLKLHEDPETPFQAFGFNEMIGVARKRAEEALQKQDADIGIGIENGLVQIERGGWFDFGCVLLLTKEGKESISFSAGFFIPDWVVSEVKDKKIPLHEIVQKLALDSGTDPVDHFSGSVLMREEILKDAVISAFSKILHHERYHL